MSQLLDRGLKRNMIADAEKRGILIRTFDPVINLYYYIVNPELFNEDL